MIKIRFRKAQKGQGLVEYATIVSLVSIVSIVILSLVGLAVARNYAVVASVFGGKKNAASSAVSGLTNTIYIEPSSPPVECHVAKAGGTTCPGLSFCGANGATYVRFQLYASPDIQAQDLALSVNNVYVPSQSTGSAASMLIRAQIAMSADESYCGEGIVITGKKAITIVPITAVINDP